MFYNDLKNRPLPGAPVSGGEPKGPVPIQGGPGPTPVPGLKPSGFARPGQYTQEKWVKVVDDQNVKTFNQALSDEINRTLPAQVPQALSQITDFFLQIPFLGELTLKALHVPVVVWKKSTYPSQISVSVDRQAVMVFENYDLLSSDFHIAISDQINSVKEVEKALKKLEEAKATLVAKGSYDGVTAALCQEIRRNLTAKRHTLKAKENPQPSSSYFFQRVTLDKPDGHTLNIECTIENDQVTLLAQDNNNEKAGFVFDLKNPEGNVQFLSEAKALLNLFVSAHPANGDSSDQALKAQLARVGSFLDSAIANAKPEKSTPGKTTGDLIKNLKRTFDRATSQSTHEVGLLRKNEWTFSMQGNVLALHKDGILESSIDLSNYYLNKDHYQSEFDRWLRVLNAFQEENKGGDSDAGVLYEALEQLQHGLTSGIHFVYCGVGFKEAPKFADAFRQKPDTDAFVTPKLQETLQSGAETIRAAVVERGMNPDNVREISKPTGDFLLFADKDRNNQIQASELDVETLKALFFLKHNQSRSFFEALPFLDHDAKQVFQFLDRNNDMRKGTEIEMLGQWDELLITRDRHTQNFYLDYALLNSQIKNFKSLIYPFLGDDFRATFAAEKEEMPKDLPKVSGLANPFFANGSSEDAVSMIEVVGAENSTLQTLFNQLPAPERKTHVHVLPSFSNDPANLYQEFTFDSGVNTKEDPDSRVHVSLRNGRELRIQGWRNGTLWTLFGDRVNEVVLDLSCPFPPSVKDSDMARKALTLFEQFLLNINTRDGQIQPAAYSMQAKGLAQIRDALKHYVNNQPPDFSDNILKGQRVIYGKEKTLWLKLSPSGDVESVRGFNQRLRQANSEKTSPDFSIMVESAYLSPAERNHVFSYILKLRDELTDHGGDDVTLTYLNRALEKLRSPLFWHEYFDVGLNRNIRGRTAHYGDRAIRLELSHTIENGELKQFVRLIKWRGESTHNSDSKTYDLSFELSAAGLAEVDGVSVGEIKMLISEWEEILKVQNKGKNYYGLDQRTAQSLREKLTAIEEKRDQSPSVFPEGVLKTLAGLSNLVAAAKPDPLTHAKLLVLRAQALCLFANCNDMETLVQVSHLCMQAREAISPKDVRESVEAKILLEQISRVEGLKHTDPKNVIDPFQLLLKINQTIHTFSAQAPEVLVPLDQLGVHAFMACAEKTRSLGSESEESIGLASELRITRPPNNRSLAACALQSLQRLAKAAAFDQRQYLDTAYDFITNEHASQETSSLTDHLRQELIASGISPQKIDQGFDVFIDGQWRHFNPQGESARDILSSEEIWNVFAHEHTNQTQGILRKYGIETPFTQVNENLISEAFALFEAVKNLDVEKSKDDVQVAFQIYRSVCGSSQDLRTLFKASQILNILAREGKIKLTPQFVIDYSTKSPQLVLGVYNDQQFWALSPLSEKATVFPLSTREAMAFYFVAKGQDVLQGKNVDAQVLDPAEQAVAYFRTALTIDSRSVEAIRGLTKAIIAQGHGTSIRDGILELEMLRKKAANPQYFSDAYFESQIQVMIGLLNIERGYLHAAKKALQDALVINPNDTFCKKVIVSIDEKQLVYVQPTFKVISADQFKGLALNEMAIRKDLSHEQFLDLCRQTYLKAFQQHNALAQGRKDYTFTDHVWLVTRSHLAMFMKNLRQRQQLTTGGEAQFPQDFVLSPQALLGITPEEKFALYDYFKFLGWSPEFCLRSIQFDPNSALGSDAGRMSLEDLRLDIRLSPPGIGPEQEVFLEDLFFNDTKDALIKYKIDTESAWSADNHVQNALSYVVARKRDQVFLWMALKYDTSRTNIAAYRRLIHLIASAQEGDLGEIKERMVAVGFDKTAIQSLNATDLIDFIETEFIAKMSGIIPRKDVVEHFIGDPTLHLESVGFKGNLEEARRTPVAAQAIAKLLAADAALGPTGQNGPLGAFSALQLAQAYKSQRQHAEALTYYKRALSLLLPSATNGNENTEMTVQVLIDIGLIVSTYLHQDPSAATIGILGEIEAMVESNARSNPQHFVRHLSAFSNSEPSSTVEQSGRLGLLRLAAICFEGAKYLSPTDIDAQMAYVAILRERGRTREALFQVQRLLQESFRFNSAQRSNLYTQLADCEVEMAQYDSALVNYQKAFDLSHEEERGLTFSRIISLFDRLGKNDTRFRTEGIAWISNVPANFLSGSLRAVATLTKLKWLAEAPEKSSEFEASLTGINQLVSGENTSLDAQSRAFLIEAMFVAGKFFLEKKNDSQKAIDCFTKGLILFDGNVAKVLKDEPVVFDVSGKTFEKTVEAKAKYFTAKIAPENRSMFFGHAYHLALAYAADPNMNETARTILGSLMALRNYQETQVLEKWTELSLASFRASFPQENNQEGALREQKKALDAIESVIQEKIYDIRIIQSYPNSSASEVVSTNFVSTLYAMKALVLKEKQTLGFAEDELVAQAEKSARALNTLPRQDVFKAAMLDYIKITLWISLNMELGRRADASKFEAARKKLSGLEDDDYKTSESATLQEAFKRKQDELFELEDWEADIQGPVSGEARALFFLRTSRYLFNAYSRYKVNPASDEAKKLRSVLDDSNLQTIRHALASNDRASVDRKAREIPHFYRKVFILALWNFDRMVEAVARGDRDQVAAYRKEITQAKRILEIGDDRFAVYVLGLMEESLSQIGHSEIRRVYAQKRQEIFHEVLGSGGWR